MRNKNMCFIIDKIPKKDTNVKVSFNDADREIVDKLSKVKGYNNLEEYVHDVALQKNTDHTVVKDKVNAIFVRRLCELSNLANKISNPDVGNISNEDLKFYGRQIGEEVLGLWQAIL